ncbi:MAG: ROK family transcriptional regulator [Bifidobacteriaceae bacterium]|jgi:predicted NBD/HSP70 family sugar kinase|nr:ROK family transcriptional regulator [Bifidobacteriaceae bacterium]
MSIVLEPLSTATGSPHARATLHALRAKPALTLAELVRRTGLSRPTLTAALQELIDLGWAAAIEPGQAPAGHAGRSGRSVGRPARRYRFRREAAPVVGVDVGLHKTLTVVSDLSGTVVAERRQDLPEAMTSAGRVDAVAEAVTEALALAPTGVPPLAIAIGTPGVVDRSGRIVVCPPIPEWDGIDLGGRLADRFDCPVQVENDVMAAAVAERSAGAARGCDDFVYLLAGHRISSAAVIGGRLHRGHSGAAGMVGELAAVGWPGAPARLTDYAAVAGHPSARDVFAAAAAGEAGAVEAVDAFLDDLALGLAAVVLAIDPELVVIGGGISLAGGDVAAKLRARIAERAHLVSPRVEISGLGNRGTALGAARLALEHVEATLLV